MPDVDIFKQPAPVTSIPILPEQPQTAQRPSSVLDLPTVDNTPMWVATQASQVPYKTRLDQTLRYTDPNIGFNPFDQDLEYKYANAHPVISFRNNVIKGLADFAGAFAETFATIPIAINAAVNQDFSKLYDNDLTNSIQDWKESLDTYLPTYKNRNQTEHPLLSWFDGDFFNNLGGAIHGLGFAGGAIIGTIAEGAVITALTGGVGTLPAIGANITRFLGRFSRAVAASAEGAAEIGSLTRTALKAAPEIAQGERSLLIGTGTERASLRAGELAPTEAAVTPPIETPAGAATISKGVSLINPAEEVGAAALSEAPTVATTTTEALGPTQEFASTIGATRNKVVNDITKGLDKLYKVTKFTDAVRYNLSLLTSAMSMGVFEANSVQRNTENLAKQDFFDKNGYDAPPEELDRIKETAKDAANFTMGANMAMLYLTNRINWSTLFKPTVSTIEAGASKALVGNPITGYKKLATVLNKEKGLYEVLDQTPTSRIGKILLRVPGTAKTLKQPLTFIGQGAGMGLIREGATDYAIRKYDGLNRGDLGDYIKSFNYAYNKTLASKEGFANMVDSFVTGVLLGGLEHVANKAIGIKKLPARARLEAQANALNTATFKGLFTHTIDGAAAMQSMAADYTKALKAGDIFTAKNLKAEMLHNWVNTAVRTNTYDLRLDELSAAKDLKGEEFSKMWGGLEYNDQNRQQAVDYIENIRTKSEGVRKDIQKIERLFTGNPFNEKTQAADFRAHNDWKDMLARNLGLSRDYQARVKQLEADITKLSPQIDTNRAIALTTKQGIRETIAEISKAIDNIGKQREDEKGLGLSGMGSDLAYKQSKLEQLRTELQQHVYNNFEGKSFVEPLSKLYKLMSGLDFENNALVNKPTKEFAELDRLDTKLNSDDIADIFERLHDITRLHQVNYDAVSAYNNLLKPRGAKGYMNYAKGLVTAANSNIKLSDTGKVETPANLEREAEEEAILRHNHMDEEEVPVDERKATNDAAIKKANGEELTEEEQALLDKNPKLAEKAETIETTKKALLAKKTNKAPQEPEITEKNYKTDESGFRKELSPVELLNKLNSHETVGKQGEASKNLFKAIFGKVNNFLKSGLTAKLAKSEFKKEQEANGNVKQKYKAISLFDASGKKVGESGIYKARYERNIEIYHNGEFIGLLKPADSLSLDSEGKRTIYEMTEAEFQGITGQPRSEYKAYMKELNTYKKAHDDLLSEFGSGKEKPTVNDLKVGTKLEGEDYNYTVTDFNENGAPKVERTDKETGVKSNTIIGLERLDEYFKDGRLKLIGEKANKSVIDNATLLKYFPDIKVNTGNAILNKGEDKANDTLIKDLAHKPTGTALISVKDEAGITKATIVNDAELAKNNPDYYNKLKDFMRGANFKAYTNTMDGRYLLAVPVNGEYLTKSLIFSRPAEIDTTAKETITSLLKDNLGKQLTAKQTTEINDRLHQEYYIANAERQVPGTKIDLLINEDGTLSIKIANNTKANPYQNTLHVPDAKITDYNSIIQTIQKRIADEEYLDPKLQKLQITVKSDSIKHQIPNDKDVRKLSEIEGKVKVATTPNVFENYSVNFYPKGSRKGEPLPEKPQAPKPVTEKEKTTLVETMKALKPVSGKISDIEATLSNEHPERMLEEIADQAFGVTRDQDGNRVPDENGSAEPQLIEKYGKDIVEGAKRLFPLEPLPEAPREKTQAEIEQEKQNAIKAQADQTIDQEYTQKKQALHDQFINTLTEPSKKIKDFITKNPNFVGQDIAKVYEDIAKSAQVSANDVLDYMQQVRAYNVQRAKLNDIAEAKKSGEVSGSTGTPVFSKNVAETSIIMQDLFGLPKDQADRTAALYEHNRQAYVERAYNTELAHRQGAGTSSPEYVIGHTEKQVRAIESKIQDFKDQQDLTNDDGRKMIIQAKIDAEEAKLKEGAKTLYGVDLKEHIEQKSHTRFGFGKKTPEELGANDLTQEMDANTIKKELQTNKIIDLNCN